MTVGGMNWFSEFAPPQKANGSELPKGLSTKKASYQFALKNNFNANEGNQIKAQGLPYFDPEHPDKDFLYGYDMYLEYPEKGKEVMDCKAWKSNRDGQKNEQRWRRG